MTEPGEQQHKHLPLHWRLLGYALLLYSAAILVRVEAWNHSLGGPLPHWRAYADQGLSGSGADSMRFAPGLQELLVFWGAPVYPGCVIAAGVFFVAAVRAEERTRKLAALGGAVLCLLILGRFWFLCSDL